MRPDQSNKFIKHSVLTKMRFEINIMIAAAVCVILSLESKKKEKDFKFIQVI